MSLDKLVDLSRLYGSDPDYVVAGGGNTSFKNADTLWVKSSGVSLAGIGPEGFAALDRKKLAGIWTSSRPGSPAAQEEAVLAALLAARKKGEEHKRPSVETLLHDLLPFAYVVHTHPSMVNGLTCSREGERAVRRLFGDDPLWLPISDPGFVLAAAVREKLEGRAPPEIVFLQNHGIFVSADNPGAVKALYKKIMETITANITRRPDFSGECSGYRNSGETGAALTKAAETDGRPRCAVFRRNNEIARLVRDRASFQPVSSAYTPDHIVYSGSDPLFIEDGDDPASAWKAHTEKTGRPAKIAAVRGLGVFGLGPSSSLAELALELFTDTIKVAAYAESFGGPNFMTAEKIAFINNWEAEQYRQKLVETKPEFLTGKPL